jgi:hypothetical protein
MDNGLCSLLFPRHFARYSAANPLLIAVFPCAICSLRVVVEERIDELSRFGDSLNAEMKRVRKATAETRKESA